MVTGEAWSVLVDSWQIDLSGSLLVRKGAILDASSAVEGTRWRRNTFLLEDLGEIAIFIEWIQHFRGI